MQASGKRSAFRALLFLALSSCLVVLTFGSALEVSDSPNAGLQHRVRPLLLRRALPSNQGSVAPPTTTVAEAHASPLPNGYNLIVASLSNVVATFEHRNVRHGFPDPYLNDLYLLEFLVRQAERMQERSQAARDDPKLQPLLDQARKIIWTGEAEQPWMRPNDLFMHAYVALKSALQMLQNAHAGVGWDAYREPAEEMLLFICNRDEAMRTTLHSLRKWAVELGDGDLFGQVPKLVETPTSQVMEQALEQVKVTVEISKELAKVTQMQMGSISASEHQDFGVVEQSLKGLVGRYDRLKETLDRLDTGLGGLGDGIVSLARKVPDM